MSNEAILPTNISTAHAVINQLTLKNQELLWRIQDLQQQVDWFRRQIFGEKSEKKNIPFADLGLLEQLWLGGEAPQEQAALIDPSTTIKEHTRKRVGKEALEDDCGESGLRFDSTVPVEEIACPPSEIEGLSPDQYEVIDTKYTERLCQRQGSYYIKRYVRPVVKIKESQTIVALPAPEAVLGRSYSDVTLLAGIAVDKFMYHLPLFRQHQRIERAGIMIARGNLTSWLHKAAHLLKPIYNAVLVSVLNSQVLAMDETSLKAGIEKKGKLHRGYVWVLYGDKDEAAFMYSPTRALNAIEPYVKNFCGTLITDGYTVYELLAAKYGGILHALCWAHTRREFFEGQAYEPVLCHKALAYIGKLYAEEAKIRKLEFTGEKKLLYRVEHERDVVDQFFEWLKVEVKNNSLLPSNRFLKAANYALKREDGLRLYLANPDVPIDTNHIEREIRPIPLGRKNWMFCWSEVGAEVVAIFETLISSCKLQGVNPFEYLVDVLQSIEIHPMSRVSELTPREWAARKNKKKAIQAIDVADALE